MQPASTERIIFHVDVNSAFLSWSALKQLRTDPGSIDLRTIPSAVGGDVKTRHGIITAKSIPAKKYGITTGEPVVKALQKCPQLVLVPSDFETYRHYSHALMDLLATFTPVIQQVSIDEAFLDMTDPIRETILRASALQNAAHAGSSPQDNDFYSAIDETRRQAAIRTAAEIRSTVYSRLGFTVNVGISSNKLLAKMASDFTKPDRTHTLFPDEVADKMWPLPIGKLFGCGKATSDRLVSVGIHTIGDAAAADETFLCALLGEKSGTYISQSARGISHSHVHTERAAAKSYSNETTMPFDIDQDNFRKNGKETIRRLSDKVAGRLQRDGVRGQTITFQIKTTDFKRHSRQTSLPVPTDRGEEIYAHAFALASNFLEGADGLFSRGGKVRLIGVGVSSLTSEPVRQMDLFSWAEEKKAADAAALQEKNNQIRSQKLDDMLRSVQKKYGTGSLHKGEHPGSVSFGEADQTSI